MFKGTTPTHIFSIPFHVRMVKKVLVVYSQNGTEILRKQTEDCILEENTIGIPLTQEETFKFNHKCNVQVQIRVLTTEDIAYASPIFVKSAKQCLSNEVI